MPVGWPLRHLDQAVGGVHLENWEYDEVFVALNVHIVYLIPPSLTTLFRRIFSLLGLTEKKLIRAYNRSD